MDIAFGKAKIAVFMDGCFWHGCPEHATQPKSNAEWWRAKLDKNTARDRETTAHLEAEGWTVLRFGNTSRPRPSPSRSREHDTAARADEDRSARQPDCGRSETDHEG